MEANIATRINRRVVDNFGSQERRVAAGVFSEYSESRSSSGATSLTSSYTDLSSFW